MVFVIRYNEIPPNVDIATKIGMKNANGPYILSANVCVRIRED